MHEILGYFSALLIGITLGLIGGGGSILTVPVLVYILGVNPVLATAYSLFIVGTTALVGAFKNGIQGTIDYKTGFVFAVPSFIAVYFTRRVLLNAIPQEILSLNNFVLTKNTAIMLFFALVMLMASISMIKGRKTSVEKSKRVFNYPVIIAEGLFVGLVTGLVGAGGGFLIIPALVLLVGLPMKKAVGTSLMIIALKSLIGFTGDLSSGLQINWNLLLVFSSLSVLGILIGSYVSKFIEGARLKKVFGYFVLSMAIIVILKELIL
tara:strand:+ start:9488 stop:10282 length:795 start_codon:yes stop_codon:yes gene_type:complete